MATIDCDAAVVGGSVVLAHIDDELAETAAMLGFATLFGVANVNVAPRPAPPLVRPTPPTVGSRQIVPPPPTFHPTIARPVRKPIQ